VATRLRTPARSVSRPERTASSAVSRPGRRPPTRDVEEVAPRVETALVTPLTMPAARLATSAELWRRESGEVALSAANEAAAVVRWVSISVISGSAVRIVALPALPIEAERGQEMYVAGRKRERQRTDLRERVRERRVERLEDGQDVGVVALDGDGAREDDAEEGEEEEREGGGVLGEHGD
jgi:hypothetical protein